MAVNIIYLFCFEWVGKALNSNVMLSVENDILACAYREDKWLFYDDDYIFLKISKDISMFITLY